MSDARHTDTKDNNKKSKERNANQTGNEIAHTHTPYSQYNNNNNNSDDKNEINNSIIPL